MNAIHIRNVDPATLGALKRMAGAHRRSLQAELHVILERAARMAPEGGVEELRLVTVRTGHTGVWCRSEMYGDSGR